MVFFLASVCAVYEALFADYFNSFYEVFVFNFPFTKVVFSFYTLLNYCTMIGLSLNLSTRAVIPADTVRFISASLTSESDIITYFSKSRFCLHLSRPLLM